MEISKVNNDMNGNPRYVIHYLGIADTFDDALAKAKKIGGKVYRGKGIGGGIVFQTYNIQDIINKLK